MFPAFTTALSALTADSTAINVTGNNLANLNTNGFKASQADFSDLMSQTIGVGSGAQVGLGVGALQTSALYTQGSLTASGGALDSAIQGNGFFVVQDPSSGQQLYTRDGSFQLDATGNLQTSTGQFVQGWSAVNGVVNPNGPVGNISIPIGAVIPATATTTMAMGVNLNASVALTDPGATFAAPIQVFDSLGSSHTLTVTFTKTAANSWDYSVTAPNSDFTTAPTAPLANGTLTFDGNGNLTAPKPTDPPVSIKVTGLADGANDLSVNWNLFDASGNGLVTQFAQASGESSPQQNGFAAGQVTKVSMSDGGLITASYSNGKTSTVGQLAMASIANPQSLVAVGDNNLQASAATAPPAIGAANSAGLGQIKGGYLEASNADMATEFTNLLTYERSYQAASRVITTSDQLMQETVNLIHP
jgi:flagellar hook protein FlgE